MATASGCNVCESSERRVRSMVNRTAATSGVISSEVHVEVGVNGRGGCAGDAST